jgi:thiol-disulfide isomerase/thioredoxin
LTAGPLPAWIIYSLNVVFGVAEVFSMKRSATVAWVGAAVMTLALVFSVARAADGSKKSVDELAKECYWGEPDTWIEHSKFLGQSAPALDLTDWHGTPVKADDIKNKIVVIDFWATWCPPCKAAVPHNNELAKKYADKGVLVVGACGGEGQDKMNAVAAETKMEYPTGKAGEQTTKAWGLQSYPHYVIVDRKGKIRALGIRPDAVERVVQALLDEDSPAH